MLNLGRTPSIAIVNGLERYCNRRQGCRCTRHLKKNARLNCQEAQSALTIQTITTIRTIVPSIPYPNMPASLPSLLQVSQWGTAW